MNLSNQHHLYSNTSKDLSLKDYYPFGMVMPERSFSTDNYRFGYNGAEFDNEINGFGNSYTTTYRLYNPRLGRWASVDPKWQMFPEHSSYQAQLNNPIYWNDPQGDCPPCWAVGRWLALRAIPLFTTGALTSLSTQFVGNYIHYDNAQLAASNLDIVDAAADGSINVITGGAGSLRALFKEGTTVAIRKMSAVLTLELVSASTDFTFENSEFESVFGGDKSLFEATSSFVLSLSGEYSADQIKTVFKKWGTNDLIPSNFAPKNRAEQELALKMDKLVKSNGFQNSLEGGTSIMEEFVEAILQSNVNMEVMKVSEKSTFQLPTDRESGLYNQTPPQLLMEKQKEN